MNLQKKAAIYVGFLILGIVLFSLSLSEILDSFWSGCGGALIAVALMRLCSYYKFATDAEYAKAAQTKYNDERNNYLANKAAALTVRWGLLALAIMVFILQIAGYKAYSTLLGFVVCALLVVYYVSYMYLKKKY